LEIPLAAVTSILHDAGNPALRQEWDKLFAGKKRNRDVLVVKAKEGTKLNPLEGTFGDADDKGEKIAFELSSGKTSVPLTRIHGLYFQRGVDAGAAPVICKLFDTGRNVVFATSVTLDETAYTVATPAGVKIVFSRPAVARLDFSKGKLTFLSDVPPSKLKVTLKGVTGEVVDPLHPSKDLDTIDPVCRDRNLDGRPLRLGGTAYPKGLAIHAGTELVFDLAGEYREFKAMVGVDDSVLGWSAETAVHVEADGKELANLTVSRKEKPKPLTLNVKDVQKLRIVVSSTNVLQYGRHAELADAKVTK
jgi:hypothetical protein